MPTRVKRLRRWLSALLLAISAPGIAAAEVEDVDELDRWVPAVAVTSGLVFQNSDASIESGPVLGPSSPSPNRTQPIRPFARGDALLMSPDVGIGLEIMTPRLARRAWAPRLFGYAGVSGSFGPSRDVAKEGVIQDLLVPDNVIGPEEEAVLGQGSRTRANVQELMVRAGVGVAFTFDVLERRVRVRTSLEYLREEIKVQGAVRRAICIVDGATPAQPCGAIGVPAGGGISEFREIDLRDEETDDFHGLGPGIEFETDVGRLGPFVTSINMGAQFYRFLGSREIEFTTTNEFGETASTKFEKDPWAYRAGVGIRFRWLPE